MLGEGHSLGKAQYTIFVLSGTLSWVGKHAWLNANALSLWEGRQLITQTTTKWFVEARGPGCPNLCLSASLPFRVSQLWWARGSRVPTSAWRSPGILTGCHTMTGGYSMTETGCHNMARTMTRGDETCGQHQPWHPHLHQTVGSRVIEVQCQLPHQCHHVPADLGAPGIPTMADATGSLEAIWRLICQSSRVRMQRTPSVIKVGIGI